MLGVGLPSRRGKPAGKTLVSAVRLLRRRGVLVVVTLVSSYNEAPPPQWGRGIYFGRIFMGTEIERKFLVKGDAWREAKTHFNMAPEDITQGYLVTGPVSVRVRQTLYDGYDIVEVCIKGPGTIQRPEFEYDVNEEDFDGILALCGSKIIKKTRHFVDHAGKCWEVDVFSDVHSGLVTAEIELYKVDDDIAVPPWIGKEVTEDIRYSNAYLAEHGAWWK
jgi:CYTH domain-containing protein